MEDTFQLYPLKLIPFLVDRPWGGMRLQQRLNKGPLSAGKGEAWELSDSPEAPSIVGNGVYGGRRFTELLRRHTERLVGVPHLPDGFPMLVKYIDASDHLSIQVHPGDEEARKLGRRGKTESWYVLDCEEGAELLCGLEEGVTEADLRRRAGTPGITELVSRVPVRPGTFVQVPAGTVHAILKGTLICEISQASTLVERLWDWGRPRQRERHVDVERALRLIRFEPDPAEPRMSVIDTSNLSGMRELGSNEHFQVRMLRIEAGSQDLHLENPHGAVICVVEGEGRFCVPGSVPEHAEGRLGLGETWFLPPSLDRLTLTASSSGLRILISRSLEIGRTAEAAPSAGG